MVRLAKPRIPGQARAAMFYFCFMGAGGAIGPFLYVTYRHHGLSPSQIGIVIAVAHVVNFVVSPIWGAISDLVRRNRQVRPLAIACFGAGPAILLVWATRDLLPTLGAVVFWSLFAGGIVSLADTATLHLLGDDRDSYGRVRVWGSVGGVLASLIAGRLGSLVGLDVIFPIYTVLLIFCGLVACALPTPGFELKPNINHGVTKLLRDVRVPLFLVSVLFVGVGYMGWRSTFSLYLEDLGGDAGIMGAFFALSSLVEIPIMATSRRWIGAVKGRRALLVAFAVFALLWFGSSLLVSPAIALWLALVHGLSYAIYLVAGVLYMREISPPEYTGLAQGVYGGFSRGLGSIAGSLAGGVLYEQIGGSALYRLSAYAGLIALFLLGLTQVTSAVRRRWQESGAD